MILEVAITGAWLVVMVGYIVIKVKGKSISKHNGLDISNELRKYKNIQSNQNTKLFGK